MKLFFRSLAELVRYRNLLRTPRYFPHAERDDLEQRLSRHCAIRTVSSFAMRPSTLCMSRRPRAGGNFVTISL